jgi:hypothetical protein
MGTPQEFALVRALAQLEGGAPAALECCAFHVSRASARGIHGDSAADAAAEA